VLEVKSDADRRGIFVKCAIVGTERQVRFVSFDRKCLFTFLIVALDWT
jgi:hypothetical protein